MNIICDCCSTQLAIVYCKSDDARLCLPCDLQVHSANSLVRHHMRALICHCCSIDNGGGPMCTNCQWMAGGGGVPANCFSGCPNIAEVSRFLASGVGGTMMSTSENCESTCRESPVVPEIDTWMTAVAAAVKHTDSNMSAVYLDRSNA